MDSAEIVFAEVQQVIGKTGKFSNLLNPVNMAKMSLKWNPY